MNDVSSESLPGYSLHRGVLVDVRRVLDVVVRDNFDYVKGCLDDAVMGCGWIKSWVLEARAGFYKKPIATLDLHLRCFTFFVAHADGKMRLNEQFTTLQSSLGAQSKQLNVVNDATGKNNRAVNLKKLNPIRRADAYDKLLNGMVLDLRARPSNRTQTVEELAQDEKERLEELDEERQKRMNVEARADNKFPAALFSSVSHILAIIYDRFLDCCLQLCDAGIGPVWISVSNAYCLGFKWNILSLSRKMEYVIMLAL
ncbi:nucleolar protein 14 [Tanacetum coccineum]